MGKIVMMVRNNKVPKFIAIGDSMIKHLSLPIPVISWPGAGLNDLFLIVEWLALFSSTVLFLGRD